MRNLMFRVVLGLSRLKGSGALIVSHPTRWTISLDPYSGCWPLGGAVDIGVKICVTFLCVEEKSVRFNCTGNVLQSCLNNPCS